jgi:hypothetical protein
MLNGVLLVVAVKLFAVVVNCVCSVCSGDELFDGKQNVVNPRP